MQYMQIEKIGKVKALEYLEKNTKNRKVSPSNVDFLVKSMIDGEFKLNGQTIVFSENGTLLDGQHRLMAIVKSGLEFDFIVVRGIEEESFATIDTGRARSAGDVLSVISSKYSANKASSCRRIIERFGDNRSLSKAGGLKISNTSIIDFYNINKKEIDELTDFIARLYETETKIMSISVGVSLLYFLKRENEYKAFDFMKEVYSGVLCGECTASFTLRKRLINSKIEKITLGDNEIKNLSLSAFRAYCENRNISKIQSTCKQYFKYL